MAWTAPRTLGADPDKSGHDALVGSECLQHIKGKTAYVSGAASGIGFGVASALAQAGANIAMVDIREDALAEARARLHNLGAHVETFVSDVSDAAMLEETGAAIEAKFGPIHIVCNNAGVSMLGVRLEEIPRSDWDWVIDVNIKASSTVSEHLSRACGAMGKAATSSTPPRSPACRSTRTFGPGPMR